MEPTLSASRLRQGYGRSTVLQDISFDLGPGVTSVLGPNGAGKSTLLDVLSTSRSPRSGSVRILGTDVTVRQERRAIRENIGVLPQRFGYFPEFTVVEFVSYCAWLRHVPRHKRQPATMRALEYVGLAEQSRKRMGELSGGMLRRAGVAQAIVNDPQVLILDEPSAGLDPEQRVVLRDLILDVGKDRLVILSTHLSEDVASIGGNVLVLYDGRLAFNGSVNELERIGESRSTNSGSPIERGYAQVVDHERNQERR